jgi:hypothetical protein
MLRQLYAIVAVAAVIASCAAVCAQEKEKAQEEPVYDDPAKTDADFEFVGEYQGVLPLDDGDTKFGTQVIARGKGKFEIVSYQGGLPGDGWDRETPHRFTAQRQGNQIRVDADKGHGIVEKGIISAYDDAGNLVGKLEKVERKSPTLGADSPQGAIVLFDGTNVDQWENGKMTDDGLLMQGTTSIPKFKSHKLHLEFRLPYMPEHEGQARGNSGIYLQGRYECQMLDSFGLEGKDNECGGLYSVAAPQLNMCFPPLAWQTYDVDYKAAKFDENGELVEHPRITVLLNGVKIHDNVQLPGDRSTTAAPVGPGPEAGPVYLQDHGNPVRYQNVWVVETE